MICVCVCMCLNEFTCIFAVMHVCVCTYRDKQGQTDRE